MASVIKINKITKKYAGQRGIFDMDLTINRGEVVGIVGKNGAGKTTIMRMLMGFIKPTSGISTINNLDSWTRAHLTKQYIGYVPGEIAFPDTKSGETFLKMQLSLLQATQNEYVNDLIQRFKIDTTANIRRMSKGMKQKTALVSAFMTKPDILLLDEPTTGLDPVMRDAFIELILKVKSQGTTVFLSSHMFNELESTCDRIAFLKDGHIVDMLDKNRFQELHCYQRVTIEGESTHDYDSLIDSDFEIVSSDSMNNSVTILIHETKIQELLHLLQYIRLKNIDFTSQSLDKYFEKDLSIE